MKYNQLFKIVSLNLDTIKDILANHCPNNVCRFCKKPISEKDFAVYHSYWQGIKFPCHQSCLTEGTREEAYLCQCVDADCNDCKHYERDPNRVFKTHSIGHCNKFKKEVIGRPKFCSGYECFEHRKDQG